MFKSLLREQYGSSLVEFAISAGLVLSVILSLMDGCRALYADHFVANIAREASRYAMVRGATWSGTSCSSVSSSDCMATTANVTSFVRTSAPVGIIPANLTVTTTWPGTNPAGANCMWSGVTNSPGCTVSVKVQYSFQFVTPFLPSAALSLKSASAVAISQ